MEKYQAFLISAFLLILANFWHFFSDVYLFPLIFDYAAYGFFIFGIFKLTKNNEK